MKTLGHTIQNEVMYAFLTGPNVQTFVNFEKLFISLVFYTTLGGPLNKEVLLQSKHPPLHPSTQGRTDVLGVGQVGELPLGAIYMFSVDQF